MQKKIRIRLYDNCKGWYINQGHSPVTNKGIIYAIVAQFDAI